MSVKSLTVAMKWAVGGKQNSPLSASSSNQIQFGRQPPANDSALNEFNMSPKGECRKMSAELNSTIDDRSSSTYADAQGSEPVVKVRYID